MLLKLRLEELLLLKYLFLMILNLKLLVLFELIFWIHLILILFWFLKLLKIICKNIIVLILSFYINIARQQLLWICELLIKGLYIKLILYWLIIPCLWLLIVIAVQGHLAIKVILNWMLFNVHHIIILQKGSFLFLCYIHLLYGLILNILF